MEADPEPANSYAGSRPKSDNDAIPWWSRRDRPADLLGVLGFFIAFALLDLASRLLSRLPPEALFAESLLAGGIQARPVWFGVAVLATAFLVLRRGPRMWARWSEMDKGRVLRVVAAVFIVILVWGGALYEFNYLLGEAHLADRLLLVGLGGAALYRPVFLGPFALQSRIIASQFSFPFGTTAAQNIDDLLVISLLALAGAHLMYVLTNRTETAPVLLVLGSAVATHYFVPGISKLSLGWFGDNTISNLPLNAYTAGWLASGDGSWAVRLAGLYESANQPILAGTLLIELGSAVAAAHHRLMRLWLIPAMTFHIVLFFTIGFWFLAWIAVEASLISIFLMPSLRSWVMKNATPARAAITVAIVVGVGAALFHPPKLAWLDAPIGYGYRIEATGSSGQRYNVPMSAFAPLDQEMTLRIKELGDASPASGGYGAIGQAGFDTLMEVDGTDELRALEPDPDPVVVGQMRELVVRFMEHAIQGGTPWRDLSPPDHFWTHAPEPTYRFEEQIVEMDVFLVASFNREPRRNYTRHVLTLIAGASGAVEVVEPNEPA